jgi:hypothetical protein
MTPTDFLIMHAPGLGLTVLLVLMVVAVFVRLKKACGL